MDPKPKVSPRDFFLHLGAVVALYWSAVSLLVLLFQSINNLFPDALEYYVDPYSSGIRFAIASLIIIFPVYWVITWMINKDLAENPSKKDLWVRKWLIYVTLFVAGLAIVGDLVTLLNTFLGGEVTARFILKVLAVLLVTGGIFGYYYQELKRDVSVMNGKVKSYMIAICIAVIASIIGGFIIMGSPASQRQMRFDERRTQDLQSIQWQVINYWQQKEKLPASLADLNDPISSFMVPTDPETGASYEYGVKSDKTFELCATFATKSTNSRGNVHEPAMPSLVKGSETWQHEAGRTCFERVIDPQLYPPRKTTL
jgi:membrane protein YqaA with SNARE-associated domain